MGKTTRPFSRTPPAKISDKDRRQLARKPVINISDVEYKLLRKVSHKAFALYLELAWACDATGAVHGATYDDLRQHIKDENLVPIGRALLRSCLLELDAMKLIVFDRTTPKKVDGALGIVVAHQIAPGEA